jgi:hypothetical protein
MNNRIHCELVFLHLFQDFLSQLFAIRLRYEVYSLIIVPLCLDERLVIPIERAMTIRKHVLEHKDPAFIRHFPDLDGIKSFLEFFECLLIISILYARE